jgi:hypothetical protein
VVVQRASSTDAGRLDDLVGSGREVALLAEQPASTCNNPPAGLLGLLLADADHERTVPGDRSSGATDTSSPQASTRLPRLACEESSGCRDSPDIEKRRQRLPYGSTTSQWGNSSAVEPDSRRVPDREGVSHAARLSH